MKKKILSLVIITAVTITSLAGCGKKEGLEAYSKQELITLYKELKSNYDVLKETNANLSAEVDSLGGSTNSSAIPAISYVGDATGGISFNSRDNKIIFPGNTFQYPNAEQVKASGLISITDGVSISPGSNWIVKLNGATIEMEHSNGISGIVKVGQVSLAFDADVLRDTVLAPWFENISNSKIVYTDIFTSNSQVAVGVDASVPIMIDKEDAHLRCGMICVSGKAVTYVFVYRSQQDISKDESILSLINSIKIGNDTLKVNQ